MTTPFVFITERYRSQAEYNSTAYGLPLCEAAGLSINWIDAAYRSVIPLRQVVPAQLYNIIINLSVNLASQAGLRAALLY